jgi:hypothetical protein
VGRRKDTAKKRAAAGYADWPQTPHVDLSIDNFPEKKKGFQKSLVLSPTLF